MRTAMDHTLPVCSHSAGRRRCGFISRGLLVALIASVFALAPVSNAFARFSALVMDAQSGKVLYSGNAEMPRYPASLTKMMTLYLLFDALESGRVGLNDQIGFTAHACGQAPSKLGMRPGQRLSVEDAILALVTKSANDVAVAVAEHLSDSEYAFARRMTEKAHALGMSDTTFRNASGLPDPDQVTTAKDMAALAFALIRNFPQYYHYFGTRVFYHGGEAHANHNKMLFQYDGVDGIKTGYIRASGFNLVASASRHGRRLIGVVFGARSPGERGRIMASLLDNGFGEAPAESFETVVARNMAAPEVDDDAEERTVRASTSPARAAATASIRLGSFGDRGGAVAAARDVQRVLARSGSDGSAEITQLKGKGRRGGVTYVASIVGLSSSDASRACSVVRKQRRGSCSVIAARPAAKSRAIEARATPSAHPDRAATRAKSVRSASNDRGGKSIQRTKAIAQPKAKPTRTVAARTSKAAAGKSVASKRGSGPWGVQVGAFNSAKVALKTAKAAKARAARSLGDGRVQVQKIDKKKREALYRARVSGIDREEALDACRILSSQDFSCSVFHF